MEYDNRIQALETSNKVVHKTIKELQDKIKTLELQLQAYKVVKKNMALDESQKKSEESKKKKEPNYNWVEFDLKHSEEYNKGFEEGKQTTLEKIVNDISSLGLFTDWYV